MEGWDSEDPIYPLVERLVALLGIDAAPVRMGTPGYHTFPTWGGPKPGQSSFSIAMHPDYVVLIVYGLREDSPRWGLHFYYARILDYLDYAPGPDDLWVELSGAQVPTTPGSIADGSDLLTEDDRTLLLAIDMATDGLLSRGLELSGDTALLEWLSEATYEAKQEAATAFPLRHFSAAQRRSADGDR